MTELLRNQIIGNTPRSFILPKQEDLKVPIFRGDLNSYKIRKANVFFHPMRHLAPPAPVK